MPQVGCIGFCMGGSLSLLAAEHAKVDAAVSFYGTPASKKELSHVRSLPAHCVLHLTASYHTTSPCASGSTQHCMRLTHLFKQALAAAEAGTDCMQHMDVVGRQSSLFTL